MDGSGSSHHQVGHGLQNNPSTSRRMNLSFDPRQAVWYRVDPGISSDDGGAGGRYNGGDVVNDEPNMNRSTQPSNKKRGRPRKEDVNSCFTLRLPNPSAVSDSSGVGLKIFSGESSMPTSPKKIIGRPFGPKSKPKTKANPEAAESEMTMHVLILEAGNDVYNAISTFVESSHRSFCILSATGDVCKGLVRLSGSPTPVPFLATFKIMLLTGTFILSENDGIRKREGSLSLILADKNGRLLGGEVAGHFQATTTVRVMMCSFIPPTSDLSMINSTLTSVLLPYLMSEIESDPSALPPLRIIDQPGDEQNRRPRGHPFGF